MPLLAPLPLAPPGLVPSLTPGDAVLRAARLLLPVREIAGQQNRGRFVEAIIRAAGGTPPEAWCASFLWWVGHGMLGHRWPLPQTRSCDVLLEFARRRGVLRETPMTHGIFLALRTDHDAYHTGFVEDLAAGYGPGAFRTIEGNSNDDGSANGDGVYALIRGEAEAIDGNPPDQTRYAFVAWPELLT